MSRLCKIAAIVSLLLVAATPAQAAVEYSVTYLGNFSPTGINNSGEVIGNTQAESGASQAVLYSNGVLANLGPLGDQAYGINNYGDIVGHMATADELHAFLYSDGTMNDLGTFGGISADANGINNKGQIVANYTSTDGVIHAILYDHGSITPLGNLGGSVTIAKVINSNGVIAGQGITSQGEQHPFVYQDGHVTDLGIACTYGHANAINDAGQIVGDWGNANANVPVCAFRYENEVLPMWIVSSLALRRIASIRMATW